MTKTSPPFDIHLVEQADIRDFAALIHAMDLYYESPIAETIDETAAYIAEIGVGPRAPIEALIARQAGTAIGFASFNKLFPTDDGRLGMHLKDLFIASEARGQGIGRALMIELTRICQARGYKRLIWTTTHDNEAAKVLYDSLGAERREEKLAYRLDAQGLARLSAAG